MASQADIKNGLAITAVADKDIKDAKRFTAAQIMIPLAPSVMTAPNAIAPISTPAATTPPATNQPVK